MSRRTMLALLLWLIAGPALASRLVPDERVPKVDDELGALLKENPASTTQLGREGRVKLEGRVVNGRRGGGYGHGHGGALPSFLEEDPASRSRHLEHEGRRLSGRGGDRAVPNLPNEGRTSSHSEHEGEIQLPEVDVAGEVAVEAEAKAEAGTTVVLDKGEGMTIKETVEMVEEAVTAVTEGSALATVLVVAQEVAVAAVAAVEDHHLQIPPKAPRRLRPQQRHQILQHLDSAFGNVLATQRIKLGENQC